MNCKLPGFMTALAVAALALAAGCGGDDSRPPGVNTATLTYGDDIAPIYYEKCVRCHQEGGIAPFRLDRYKEAKEHALVSANATKRGYMPPFHVVHDGSCGTFDTREALTTAEQQKIWDWATGGQAEGPAVTLPLPKTPSLDDASWEFKTPVFTPTAAGTAIAENDDYRCFPIDMPLTKDSFITGFEVLPGNKKLVHHIIAFQVDPARKTMSGKSNAEVMQALDAQSPDRIGWECFGAAGEGVDVEGLPVEWAPGGGPLRYPGNSGIPAKLGQKLVVQVHYNMDDPAVRGQTDSTTIRLRFADKVDRQLVFLLPDPFLDSLYREKKDSLPPGNIATSYTWKQSARQLGLEGVPYVDVLGVGPHMHQRGRKWELRLGKAGTAGADMSCIGKVEAWDFHWQRGYFYQTPPRIDDTSELQLTCQYDTSMDKEPVLPGWGTRNEMCLAILMVALPPGM
jgi:hypothetical protein